MSVNQSNTPIDSLDFDDIKENLKNYLRGQELFKDYDFEGSTLSIILDLLAYNTHYQAYYANMAANENFIDSAVMRSSIVSIAKHLNYTPRSSKAAQLLVDVKFNDNTTLDVIAGNAYLSRGTVFTGKNSDGKTVQFVTRQAYKAVRRNGENIVPNVLLYQGYIREVSYVANTQVDPDIKFVVPDATADIDTVDVFVQKSQNESIGGLIPWKRATDINVLNDSSRVFFIQNNRSGFWEIYFGDGIVGRALQNGNLVTLRYLVTEGSNGNGIGYNDSSVLRAITAADSRVTAGGEVRVRTDSATGRPIVSFGGRDREVTESIRLYAPRNYQAQDRAVTAEDYRAILGKEYSDRADSFYIWGGEENDPPQYGKVFISIKPRVGTRLSIQEKQAIERTILGTRNLLTITPEVVDPDIMYINPTVTVYYDETRTTLNKTAIEANLKNLVQTFSRTFLGVFDSNFRTSNFTSGIDGISNAINSSNVSITLSKRVEPNLSRTVSYTVKFDNPLLHPIEGYTPILSSDMFGYPDLTSTATVKPIVDSYLEDDGYGNIRIYKKVGSQKAITNKNTGSIDYKTGSILLRNFYPKYLSSGQVELKITVVPQNRDIFVRRNQILTIDSDSITAIAIPEKTVIDRNASDAAFPSA